MDTDYESYFITYSCLNQDVHFKCNKPEVSLWSRSTTIPPEKFANAKLTIIGLCLNYDTFVKVEHLNGKSHFMNHIYCIYIQQISQRTIDFFIYLKTDCLKFFESLNLTRTMNF